MSRYKMICQALCYEKKCSKESLEDSNYCYNHQYMNDYTEDMLNNLRKCKGCNNMHYTDKDTFCRVCKDHKNELRRKSRENKRNERIKLEEETCCIAMNYGNNRCKLDKIEDSEYCKNHQYMNDYAEDVIENKLKKCSRCSYMHYSENKTCPKCLDDKQNYDQIKKGEKEPEELIINEDLQKCSGCRRMMDLQGFKTCSECRDRNKKNKEIIKDKIILCKKEDCQYQRGKDNEYCGKHQADYFKEETEKIRMKVCVEYIRGCRNQLELNDKYSRCQECRDKNKIKDSKRRELKDSESDELKRCSACLECYEDDHFIGENGRETKTCKKCREQNKRADEKRDKDYVRERKRISEQNPDRKEVKRQWKYNNPDKVVSYWIKARNKKMDYMGVEEYKRKEAEYARKWRENNSEKMKEIYDNKYKDANKYYSVYKNDAFKKNVNFELTKEEFQKIVKENCYYCGEIQEKGFNGIDKIDCEGGYVIDNCVSCCEMCNFMKGTLSPNVFIKRVEHILTHNGLIKGELHPEIFQDYIGSSYFDYKTRATKRLKKDFHLSSQDFLNIVESECYICGKENTQTHNNGIDRVDSDYGYTMDNVEACCANCNYMKNNYYLDDFIDKCKKIYENTKDYEIEINLETEIFDHKLKHLNKKTKEELKEINENRKKERNEKLIESYKPKNHQKRIDKVLELRKLKAEKLKEEIKKCEEIEIIEISEREESDYSDVFERIKQIIKEDSDDLSENIKTIMTQEEKKIRDKINNKKHYKKKRELLGDEEFRRQQAEKRRIQREKKKEGMIANGELQEKKQKTEEEIKEYNRQKVQRHRDKKRKELNKYFNIVENEYSETEKIELEKEKISEIFQGVVEKKQKTEEEIKEYNRQKSQRQRDKKKAELIAQGIITERKPKTDEEIKEYNRQKVQRHRDKKKAELITQGIIAEKKQNT